jgi:Protein of unknown function (DUF2934)
MSKEVAKKVVKRAAPKRRVTKKVEATYEEIATRAYFISLEAGGEPLENWLRAERELVPA